MSSENVQAIRRLLNGFNDGDFGALDELDVHVELQDQPRIPGAAWNHGHQGAVDWAVKLWQSFGQMVLEITEPEVMGEAVVTGWRATGKGKRSGVEVATTGHCVFTMHRGKIRRVQFFETRQAALEAATAVSTNPLPRPLSP
jgi:ketosteroid isomerase-like protein